LTEVEIETGTSMPVVVESVELPIEKSCLILMALVLLKRGGSVKLTVNGADKDSEEPKPSVAVIIILAE
jgi:hypothetical protein